MKSGMLAEELGEGLRSWRAGALDRLHGLDDDEYLWEPVAGAAKDGAEILNRRAGL
jgi:hypothetical protein